MLARLELRELLAPIFGMEATPLSRPGGFGCYGDLLPQCYWPVPDGHHHDAEYDHHDAEHDGE